MVLIKITMKMTIDKKIEIKDWIGVYDGFILPDECKKVIELFEKENELQKTFSRIVSENASVNNKADKQLFCNKDNLEVWKNELKVIIANFDIALKNYIKESDLLSMVGELNYTSMKIQKTIPGQGYHTWHVEHNPDDASKRVLVWAIYLNDVEEGGETEFLHFAKRIKPKIGRIVIWPAGFPYVHRGNPPLSGKKYLLTSWINLV
jgi:hypothetical protein